MYVHGYESDPKPKRKTVLPYWLLAVALLAAAVFYPSVAKANPMAYASAGGITVTLHSEDCTVQGVANLKKRATWEEKGKSYEGCWGVHPQYGIVMFYFEDRTVVMLPGQAFQKVIGV